MNVSDKEQTSGVRRIQMDLMTRTNVADVYVAAPGTLRRHRVLNSPFRCGDHDAAERCQGPPDLPANIHHGFTVIECARTTGDVTDDGRKILIDLLELGEPRQLSKALDRAGPAPIAHGYPLNVDHQCVARLYPIDENWPPYGVGSKDLERGQRWFGRTRFGVLLSKEVPPIVVRLDHELLVQVDNELWLEVSAEFGEGRLFASNLLHALLLVFNVRLMD